MNLPESKLTYNQKKEFSKSIDSKTKIQVCLRYDDQCKNGHNTFSITGSIYENGTRVSGGCIHEEIEKYFPEFKHLIKWHLMSSDGPMHYLENTLFLASDKDCWGKRKGEPLSYEKRLYFKDFPIQQKVDSKLIAFIETNPDFEKCTIIEIKHRDYKTYGSKYTIIPDTKEWHKCEFGTYQEAEEMLTALQTIPYKIINVPTSFSKGKEPELEAARKTAVAPNATLEQLQSKEWLMKRLPDLMLEFKKDMEEIGFIY